tara:strand:- start:532 stop:756 length:225 start_codon:yes stop_codon:yes gene_type:complete
MCGRQNRQARKPRRRLVSTGLKRIVAMEKFANERGTSVFKQNTAEMPMSAAARRANRMQQTANNQRRSLLLGGE